MQKRIAGAASGLGALFDLAPAAHDGGEPERLPCRTIRHVVRSSGASRFSRGSWTRSSS
jgi:hypothetical protein